MSVSWFRNFDDAIREAHFRADIVGLRYQVYWDGANRWWNLRSTHVPLAGRGPIYAE